MLGAPNCALFITQTTLRTTNKYEIHGKLCPLCWPIIDKILFRSLSLTLSSFLYYLVHFNSDRNERIENPNCRLTEEVHQIIHYLSGIVICIRQTLIEVFKSRISNASVYHKIVMALESGEAGTTTTVEM